MSETIIYYSGCIVTIGEARAKNLIRYFTGKRCRNGHIDERRTNGSRCISCHHASQNKYAETNREKCSQRIEEYKRNNPEKRKQTQKHYKIKNKTKIREKRVKHYEKNKERILRKIKEWANKNPEKCATISRNRRTKLEKAGGKHTSDDVVNLLIKQKNRCAYCKKDVSKKYQVDHIMPVKLGGSNWPKNLQILCPTCNHRKHAKHPIDFARENGLLL